MNLESLQLHNFKNILDENVQLGAEVNCFSGKNGEGKTNVLDAIRYISMCKSYFNAADYQNINHHQEAFLLKAKITKNDEIDTISCAVSRKTKKTFKRNKKEYPRLTDHIGLYPSVMISPTDEDLIKEGSEIRRKFVNGIISQYDKAYLNDLVKYKRVLNQRNRLLKHFQTERTFDPSSLEIYDFQLIDLNQKIYEKRQNFISEFTPWFQELNQKINGGSEKVGLTYVSTCGDDLEGQFSAAVQKDRLTARTTVGIHKDDLSFLLDEYPLKKFGSQGQQKTFLIALKLAQSLFIEQATGHKPFLLLDDIFDKLDKNRVKLLMELVSEKKFGQIFITDTDEKRASALFKDLDVTLNEFIVSEGKIEPNE